MYDKKIEQELKKLAVSIRDNIVKAFEKGELQDYIFEDTLSINKNDEGEITHILFTYGGPTVYLDFEDSPGVVIASHMDNQSQAAISIGIWSDIRDVLEVL